MPILSFVVVSMLLSGSDAAPVDAISFGGGGCGKLQGGLALPCSGNNFEAFSSAACVAGRNYLHPLVQQTVVDAFGKLEEHSAKRLWQYGEMGKEQGGSLWPHRSHQNGLSADFFMPVNDERGEPGTVPISALNKFGYGLEFDKRGRLDSLSIDWKAVAAHLSALEAAGKAHGVQIERIIITPAFHALLFREARQMRQMEPLFMKKEAWVRHDEHYHVDFKVPDRLRRPLKCSK